MAETKPHLNLAFIGHVDHGKSTTVGRLMYETGAIDAHIIEEYKKEAAAKGKATFEYAWVMDSLKEERERGVTIDIAHHRFDTAKFYFTVVDCPGHRDFVKNMITGASQADAAVLVVAVPDGVMAQTKEHVFLSRTLGVNQLIVAMNKIDATTPPFDEKRFNEVKDEVGKLLKMVGYKLEEVPFVPVSGLMGDNLAKPSEHLKWYKGPTLLDALNNLKVPQKPTNLPLRVPVQDVYTISGVGTVPVGRVETGVMKKNDKIIFQPANVSGEVKSIEMHHEEVPEAYPGDNIGWNVRGVSKKDIRRGDVCGHVEKAADRSQGVQGPDRRSAASQRHLGRVHACVPLPHSSDRMHLDSDSGQAGPKVWSCQGGEPGLHQGRRRCHHHGDALKANGN